MYFSVHTFLLNSVCTCKNALVYGYLCFLRSISVYHPYYLLLSFYFFLSILHFLRQFLNVFTNSLFGGLVLSIVVPYVLWLTLSLIEGATEECRGFKSHSGMSQGLKIWGASSKGWGQKSGWRSKDRAPPLPPA